MSIVKGWFDKQKATDEPFAPSTSVPKSTTQEAIAYVGGLVLDAELAAIAGLTSAADKAPYFTGSGTAALADFTSYGRSIVAVANEAALKALVNLEIGTDVQAYDAELAALAGLTSAADKVPYFTGSGTAAVADFTAYGRSVVAVADEAAFKSLVNLEIGTDVQAYDVELAALAGLTSAADALPYFTGAGTAATTTLTAFGRSIIDDADEATFKATVNLEIGTDVQAYSARLADIAGLTASDGNIIVGDGANWVAESGATARTSLGLGTGDSPQFTGIELGHATDTTITRSSAGVIAVEGETVHTNSISRTLTASTIELGNASDTTLSRSAAGVLAVEGTVVKMVGKETIWVPAKAMTARTTNGAATGTTETTTNDVMIPTFDFDQSTEEGVGFWIAMPKSWNESTVTFEPYWTASAGTGGVVWAINAYSFSNDDAIDAAPSGQQTSTDTLIATGDLHVGPESSAITIGGTPAEGDAVYFQITRAVADGSDTLTGDAKLIGVKVFITTNAATDA